MQVEAEADKRFTFYNRKRGIIPYDGFPVLKESLTRSRKQISAIVAMTRIQRQFVGTMIDTEVAVGYTLRKTYASGTAWVSYLAVKMKYSGDLVYLAKLTSRLPPSRGWYANTIKQSLDRRWSLNVQGVVAYTLLREVRPYLHNQKAIIEVSCILEHGPIVNGDLRHPFVQCGAKHVKRGVWYWPQIDDVNNADSKAHRG